MWQDHIPAVVLGALSRCVQAGGQAERVCLLENCCCELWLQQRFAAAARDAAATWAQVGGHAAAGAGTKQGQA